jgi:hypothetical protein
VGRTTRRHTASDVYFLPTVRDRRVGAHIRNGDDDDDAENLSRCRSVRAHGPAACSTESVAPNGLLPNDAIDLVPDYELSGAAVVDGGGIGGARLPAELQLTAEQKAAIAALHDAFTQENADEVAALRHRTGAFPAPSVGRVARSPGLLAEARDPYRSRG